MNILGIDQSSNSTGFAIFTEEGDLIKHGVFNTSDITKDKNGIAYYQEKLENIKMFTEKIIRDYKIDLVCIEDTQKQANQKTFKQLNWLQGVLIQLFFELEVKWCILKPSEWRKILGITNRKRELVKKDTMKYVKNTFGVEVKKDDESDALCIGYAVVKSLQKKRCPLEIFQNTLY